MALSQKYAGKVFVPWFNTFEWRSVYNILCSDAETDYRTALEILRIWKIRTPLLSAGIEGTLILLEAMDLNQEMLTDYQISQIYSISLMRFLNLCAANNERQGTFYQSISKTDLPKWLIDIRHDIAHDHKLPSKSLLETGIKRSFIWLIEKYWRVQNETICDYIVSDTSPAKNLDVINAYIRLKNIEYSGEQAVDFEEDMLKKINQLLVTRFNQANIDIEGICTILEEMLNQSLSDVATGGMMHETYKILIAENAMLGIDLELTSEGEEEIPRNFIDLWSNLLNILFNHNLLFGLLHELFKLTDNALSDNTIKMVASLWIKEITNGLLKLKAIRKEINSSGKDHSLSNPRSLKATVKSKVEKETAEFENCLDFEATEIEFSKDVAEFQQTILEHPNIYTSKYLKSLLNLSNSSEDVEKLCNFTEKFLYPRTNVWSDEIMTTDRIDGFLPSAGCYPDSNHCESNTVKTSDMSHSNLKSIRANKWDKINDTRPFQRCPLGLLPHQMRNRNPTISF